MYVTLVSPPSGRPPGRSPLVASNDVSTTGERLTQAERRASTRARLLDATVECLAELGYARTTTTEVARRAGLSRGAQLHHFPTKAELVSAAVQHMFDLRIAEFQRLVGETPPGSNRVDQAVDIMWALFSGPFCDAWIELAVAARTDAELRPHVLAVTERHAEAIELAFRALFPPPAERNQFYEVAPKFVTALLDGLVLHRMCGYDDADGRATAVIDAAKQIAAMALPPEVTGIER